MNNNFMLTDDLLWDYADGLLSAADKNLADAYLRLHPEWQERLDALLAEKRAFASLPLEKPDAGFADRVLAAWASEQVTTRVVRQEKDWIVYAVAAAFALLVLTPIIVLLATALPALTLQMPELQLPSADQLGQLLAQPAVYYGALVVVAVTFLMFLEKYFHQRRILADL